MKILHVVHAYPPSVGGCQTLVERISRELVTRHGDEVTVFTTVARNTEHFVEDDGNALPAGREMENGVSVKRFAVFNGLTRPRMLLASLTYRWRLPFNEHCRTLLNGPLVLGLTDAVARSGADVILATAFPLMHMYAALRGARRGRIPIALLGALHTEDSWNYDRKMIFRAIRRADAYIALTELEREHVLSRGGAPQKTHVVGGGVDLSHFKEASGAAMRATLGIGDEPVVALISKHLQRKRFDLLIEAVKKAWEVRPEIHLILAGGRTPYTAEIESMVHDLGSEAMKRVHVLGDIDEDDKASALAACDVFALPSLRDSFGLVFLEAWASGKPVIGVDAGAIPAVIRHEEDGLLVPPDNAEALADAILRLLDDPTFAHRLGQSGLQKTRKFHTWKRVTERVRGIYGQILRNDPRSRSARS